MMDRKFVCRLQVFKSANSGDVLSFARHFADALNAHIDTRSMAVAIEQLPSGVLLVSVDVPYFHGDREALLIAMERLQCCQHELVAIRPWWKPGMVDPIPEPKKQPVVIGNGAGRRRAHKPVLAK
jgi:hypothetical protein